MIDKGIIEVDQVVLVYSQPPDEALIGVVSDVDYPIITVIVIPRTIGKNKFGKIQNIDISKKIALTIFDEERIEKCLTSKEKKFLKKIRKDTDVIDLFAGTY